MSKADIPGVVIPYERRDNKGWSWQWTSPRGTIHYNSEPHPTKAAAAAAARKWVRDNVVRPSQDSGE
ncbi:Uncharacterised protein [Mycobacteroides abscessus subsp. massiliense]|uniref:hypothetical protein n=1 Tax=Mycobacteroides abscessus TaxID=36809 RepID=UPI0009A883B4|nr:hypothetical protein [Mycobacteroides abscessus]SKM82446.1 Uncharacterised protein [Mycobacteroides abscessus subsp. massiliense]SKM99206.1 Uncharacterised protein [Mycobacteroides abscessus subsp. massiliense]SKN77791.1 Uncharacterised protein [Mycobacteroides abscessus subsp. massiliense]SKN95495.1 Uncharacterised protein [Mycobacteroides abscessus subsp. massiliense]SKO23021.1 Uncharacterised protein [Mycobacteroides abscessus subsp. massiliense]